MAVEHLPFAVSAGIILFIFSVIPTLSLVPYPTRAFRACLSKCRLEGQPRAALFIFVEKFHGCYRDGCDGGKDMRSFFGLYFVLIIFMTVGWRLFLQINKTIDNKFYYQTVLMTIAALVVAYVKPYKKKYVNFLATLLLAHFALLQNLLELSVVRHLPFHTFSTHFTVLCLIPFAVFVILTSLKLSVNLYKSRKHGINVCRKQGYQPLGNYAASED